MKRVWAGLLLLAACDEPTVITHVGRDSSIDGSDLVAMQSGGGIPTEIFGTPFEGAEPEQLTEALRPPAGGAQGVRWRAVETGHDRHGTRMVLHFNPLGPPNPSADCKQTSPVPTGPPRAEGFEVTMSFCKGGSAEARGHMRALKVAPGDFEAYQNAMRQLLNAIFIEAGSER